MLKGFEFRRIASHSAGLRIVRDLTVATGCHFYSVQTSRVELAAGTKMKLLCKEKREFYTSMENANDKMRN